MVVTVSRPQPADYEALITTDVFKPARYLGNELGAVHKPWDKAVIRWVLTYPEVYEVGSSNLGHILLYNVINAQPRQLCDRTYLPAKDLCDKLKEKDYPLFALESRRSLQEFDILGFSLSYELGATNILEMLSLAQIPLTWQERENGDYPFIFAGGQTATSNPEPYADFFDFVVLGDGEELLPEVGFILEEAKVNGLSKEETLLDLAQVPGVYVPRFYEMAAADGSVHPIRDDVPKRILRRVATPIPAYSIGLVPFVETVHDRLTVEIRRGCTRGCRFCQPGMLTRPATDVEPEKVVDAIEKGMRATGYNEFSLLSLSCSDYLALPAVGIEIRNRLKDENVSLSLPSQRVDRFDENIANVVGGTRKAGLTFAPEAGTQRMRDVINKGLTNEELLRGIQTAVKEGWNKVKLYFMIGLPGETDVDVLGIAETLRWLRQECAHLSNKRLNFNITISNFTPKPHTPFQWHSVSSSEFQRKRELLEAEMRKIKGLKVNYTDYRISAMEDFVGRGDRRLSKVVRRAWELGAGMDAWWENLDKAYGAWEQAIAESDLTWKYRKVESGEWNVFETSDSDPLDAPLPWDHINTGIDKQWLKDDLRRALEAATVPDCAFDGCSHCGICGTDFGHNVVYQPPEIPEFVGEFQRDQQRLQRFRVRFGKKGDMRLVSHLDLVRLFDRVVRRASIPVAFTNGFHPSGRISIANALTLGATSEGEIIDFELKEILDLDDFRARLTEQLPDDIPVLSVEEVPVKSKAATQLLTEAEYLINVKTNEAIAPETWESWIQQVQEATEILFEKKSKKGKIRQINLCDRLTSICFEKTLDNNQVQIRYRGSCRNDGTLLHAEHVVYMLNHVAPEQDIQLIHTHRLNMFLEESE
ncbi:TIGR03960 family B12-binding radical SAM protein [[Limnothrix rosea] IAM M-220]|uniref:TIGR03960 family B12-binding radical SAM protein n=1 Tax=[Limnothrix rosea] IAM M-220 TaxID=454133 RepID=UPI000966512C|nr:TIGR03960 family B12-binding radical SAM protein [[Limnothrix rosea] IAM M-220]OKH17850.1 B12-binding domain-containing radical SAM protein [[Limnothrix rosea] IAM M-220]